MGQTASKDAVNPETVLESYDRLAEKHLQAIEKFNLKLNELHEDDFASKLGIQDKVGQVLVLRSASFFAAYPYSLSLKQPIVAHVLKIVALYNGKLRNVLHIHDSDWLRLLFLSLAATGQASKELGDPGDYDVEELKNVNIDSYYIQYTDFFDLVTLLVAVYDLDPWDRLDINPSDDDKEVARRLLNPFKAPIMGFDAFNIFVNLYPGILDSFARIFDRLLYFVPDSEHEHSQHEEAQKTKVRPALPKGVLAQMYFTMGPKVFDMIQLFNGSQHGFSMRAFESKVFNWKAPSFLVITGRKLTKPSHELDTLAPHVSDAAPRAAKRYVYGIWVETPWKISPKYTFANANTMLMQFAPDNVIYKVNHPADPTTVYFAPGIGVGVGMKPPQSLPIRTNTLGSISLILDSLFEYGTFRCLGEGGAMMSTIGPITKPFEDRFSIDNVQVWGLGSTQDLENQKKAWEWEKREAARRQNINVGEDRAILEMAGLVGQYEPR